MPAEDRDLSGTRFGGYDLVQLIGRGGMGLVYRARQRALDREVALKVLSPHLAANRKFIQRFVREARAAGRLSHPNVVQGFDVGEYDGRYFFAMELVEGPTLLQRLRERGPIDERLAGVVLRKTADALAHAAKHGITHRDIKPDNILLAADGEPKLADLGLAKVERRVRDDADADPDRPQSDVASSHGSETVVLGTAAYIAPEQAQAKREVDVRADLYALGMSLYHLLAGELPFPRRSRTEMLAAHCEDPMPDVRELAPKVSAGFAAILRKLGEKNPDDRPQTPEEVIEALDAVGRGDPLPWETAEGIERRRRLIAHRRRRKAVSQGGVALAVVALVGIGIAMAMPRGGGGGNNGRKPRKPRGPRPATPVASAEPPAPTDPGPEPEPPPPPDRTALDAAEAWIREHQDDLAGAITQLQVAMEGSADDGVRAEAERALAKARTAHRKALAEANRAAAEEIRKLIAAEQWKQAAARLAATDPGWRDGDEGRALAARLAEAARAAFGDLRRRVDEAQQEQDWDAARAFLQGARDWGVPEVSERAATLLATIERLAEDWEGLKRESREVASVRDAALLVRADLAKRDVEAARARCATVRVQATRAAEALADERACVDDAAACAGALADSGRLLKGQPMAIGNVKGEVVRVERGRVFLKLRSASVERALADLDAATWLQLARRALQAGATPGDGVSGNPRAGWVVLALAAGDGAAAKAAFEAGEWELDVQQRLQSRLDLAPRLEREVKAGRMLADAEAAAGRKDGARAFELLEQLEFEYADTQAVQGAEIRRRDVRRRIERLQRAGTRTEPDDGPARGGHEMPGTGG